MIYTLVIRMDVESIVTILMKKDQAIDGKNDTIKQRELKDAGNN